MKHYIAILITLVLMAVISPGVSAEEIQLYQFSESDAFVGGKSGTAPTVGLVHNDELGCLDFTHEYGETGEVYIGNMYPTTDHILELEVGIDRSNANNELYFYTTTAYIMVAKQANGNYVVRSRHTLDTGQHVLGTFTVPVAQIPNNRIKIRIECDEENRQNTVSVDEYTTTTPFRFNSSRDLPYPVLSHPIVYMESYVSGGSGNITVHIYGLTQSIQVDNVAAYPIKNYLGFGLDYQQPQYAQQGVDLMVQNGQVGTAWADPVYPNPPYTTFTDYVLDRGWELGIHYPQHLDTLSYEDAEAAIDAGAETLYSWHGSYPTSFCALANRDNITHAIYAWEEYGMYWRNGPSGISWISNVGNIHDATFPYFWASMINTGAVFPAFAHHIDDESAIQYSLSRDKFQTFSNIYKDKNIKIVGFVEYYKRGIAQAETEINIIEQDDSNIMLSVTTNGYPATILVSSEFEPVGVYRGGTQQVMHETLDGYIQFTGSSGETYLITDTPPEPAASPNPIYTALLGNVFVIIGIIGVILVIVALGLLLRVARFENGLNVLPAALAFIAGSVTVIVIVLILLVLMQSIAPIM